MAHLSNGIIPSPVGSPTANRDQVPDKELDKNIRDNSSLKNIQDNSRFKYNTSATAENHIFTIGDRSWSWVNWCESIALADFFARY